MGGKLESGGNSLISKSVDKNGEMGLMKVTGSRIIKERIPRVSIGSS